MGILYVVLSGLAVSGFSQGYKWRERAAVGGPQMVLGLAVATAACAAAATLLFRHPLVTAAALAAGLPMGFLSASSVHLYIAVVRRARLNVTWTVIQLSVVIPFLASIVFYGETMTLVRWIGIGMIAVTLALFSIGKRPGQGAERPGGAGPSLDARTALILAASSVLSGFTSFCQKVFASAAPGSSGLTLMFASGLGMIVYSLLVFLVEGMRRFRGRPRASRGSWRSAFALTGTMAVFSTIANSLTVLGLATLGGTIVFPMRGMVSLVAVFLFSFLIFRETASIVEAFGAVAAVVAIFCISSSAAGS